MKMTRFLSVSILALLLVLGVSCSEDNSKIPSKDDTENPSDGGSDNSSEDEITINVPAMPGFGAAWSRVEIDVDKPSVKWKVNDNIYIGSLNEDIEDYTSLQTLIEKGIFTVFTCNVVNEDGSAIFKGKSIPENANLAIYAGQPSYVIKTVCQDAGNANLALTASCIAEAPKGDTDFTHILENDLLIAGFDKENNSLIFGKENFSNEAFGRTFAIGKFVLTLPAGATGDLGDFVSIKGKDATEAQLTCSTSIMPYNLDSNTGLAKTKDSDGVFVIDCSNLSLKNDGAYKTVTFYSLIGQQQISGKKLNFSFKVGNITYNSTLDANMNISSPNMAIQFNLNFEGEAEKVEGDSNMQDFNDWTEWN